MFILQTMATSAEGTRLYNHEYEARGRAWERHIQNLISSLDKRLVYDMRTSEPEPLLFDSSDKHGDSCNKVHHVCQLFFCVCRISMRCVNRSLGNYQIKSNFKVISERSCVFNCILLIIYERTYMLFNSNHIVHCNVYIKNSKYVLVQFDSTNFVIWYIDMYEFECYFIVCFLELYGDYSCI